MAYPHSRGSPKAALLLAAVTVVLIVACDRSQPTAPAARAALPGAPSRTLDPGQEYTGDPNDGCWIAPDSSVFGGSTLYGGIYPYSFTRCGVPMNVWWPGFSNGVDWPLTAVFYGNDFYGFPHGHRPGFCCVEPPATGFPWTITFDKAVRNVRVYTRYVDFPGGVVRVKGAFGNLIAEKPIPIRPSSIPGRDTIAFADTNVYIVEIVPDRDPNYPPDASYPDKREFMGWQAQFQPPPCPPTQDTLLDSASVREGLLRALDSTMADPGRVERGGMIVVDRMTGSYIVSAFPQVSGGQAATDCSFPMGRPTNLDTTAYGLVAYYHTHGRVPPAGFTSCPRGTSLGSSAARGPSACDPMRPGDFCDFKVVNSLGKPMYIIDKDNIYRIVPGMRRQIQGRGEHMWKFNRGAKCVTKRVY